MSREGFAGVSDAITPARPQTPLPRSKLLLQRPKKAAFLSDSEEDEDVGDAPPRQRRMGKEVKSFFDLECFAPGGVSADEEDSSEDENV